MDSETTTKRKQGRPRRGETPKVPWDEIEKAYVCGETLNQQDDGSFERRYPSIRDLATRFGVHRSLIGYHCRRHNWPDQRLRFRDSVRTEIHQSETKARAISTEEVVWILDRYIEKFREAVESGHVRVDSISDFNVAARLKQFLLGGADSRQEIQGAITLEEIQARHRRLRDQLADLD
jgi:hypothetical protein